MKCQDYPMLIIRPYQLLCIVCSVGENDSISRNARLRELRESVRNNPDMPVSLHCNEGGVFSYQDPGTEDDTPEGSEFNRKRDMDILQRLDLAPGSILPIRVLLG